MERRDHRNPGTPGGQRREEAKGRGEPAVDVNDVEPARLEQLRQPAREPPPDGDPRHAAVGVEHDARAHAAHERGIALRPAHPRSDDGGGVATAVELEGQMMHVLRDAPQLGVVVLGDEGDAQACASCRHGSATSGARAASAAAARCTAATTAMGCSS